MHNLVSENHINEPTFPDICQRMELSERADEIMRLQHSPIPTAEEIEDMPYECRECKPIKRFKHVSDYAKHISECHTYFSIPPPEEKKTTGIGDRLRSLFRRMPKGGAIMPSKKEDKKEEEKTELQESKEAVNEKIEEIPKDDASKEETKPELEPIRQIDEESEQALAAASDMPTDQRLKLLEETSIAHKRSMDDMVQKMIFISSKLEEIGEKIFPTAVDGSQPKGGNEEVSDVVVAEVHIPLKEVPAVVSTMHKMGCDVGNISRR